MATAAGPGSLPRPPLQHTAAAPNSQTPGHPSFRRQRASRACETCHARKVRCDAASLGVPCTNCVAFSIECRVPPQKKRKTRGRTGESDSDRAGSDQDISPSADIQNQQQASQLTTAYEEHRQYGMPITALSTALAGQSATHTSDFAYNIQPRLERAPIKQAGRVACIGESANLSLLASDVVHYPLPDSVKGSRARLADLDDLEMNILTKRGAFLLPPRGLCDELVECFFQWVAPILPVINRGQFMKRYRDSKNPPSILLLQAMLLAGSRVCTNPQLMDVNGSTTPAAITFYRRAKALYDANYEDDRVSIVQSLVLMSWYWEGPEDVTKNVFYWTTVAIVVAQGSGMHRSVEDSQLSLPEKRLWKRIWWTLFTRDRSVAVALGRPVHINTEDSDVEMVTEEDFLEDDAEGYEHYPPDPVHVQFFLHYVRLCEIMGLVLSQQYSVASRSRRRNPIDLTHSDMALADWLQACPKEVYWEHSRHQFWSALLHANYYATLCLLHRAHMPPSTSEGEPGSYPPDAAYPSRNIAFQAAGMITSIIDNLQEHDQLRYTPAFIVYCLFSALIMHIYQMRSPVPSVLSATHGRMRICMGALKEVSKVWIVAKMVHTLFQSILGNKNLEERLQTAAGRRHKKPRLDSRPAQGKEGQQQRPKRNDIELGFTQGAPVPQISYERSQPQTPRPQTPVVNSSKDGGQSVQATGMDAPPAMMRSQQANESFRGDTRHGSTRPATPFGASYPVTATPPDFYLVTRNSPELSQSLWENFQPDQLFPENTAMSMPAFHDTVDLERQMPQMQEPSMQQQGMNGQQVLPSMRVLQDEQENTHETQDLVGMAQMHRMRQQNSSPGWPGQIAGEGENSNENWASPGPVIPTTLNVEDWFQFFGMHGSMNAGPNAHED